MAAPFAGFDPIVLAGSFGFVPAGFAKGAFNAIRVVILVYASLLVSFTTTSTEMMSAAASFMAPLKRTPIPVDDAACALSIALRFIPVTAEELCQVHDATALRRRMGVEAPLRNRISAFGGWRQSSSVLRPVCFSPSSSRMPLRLRTFPADALKGAVQVRVRGYTRL